MRSMFSLSLSATVGRCLPTLLCVAGCSAQATPDYVGEALLTLHGNVETRTEVDSAELGVYWLTSEPEAPCSGPTPIVGGTMLTAPAPSDPMGPDATTDCLSTCDTALNVSDLSLEAYLEWESCAEACDPTVTANVNFQFQVCASGAINQTIPVTGDFPARFSLDITQPPPASAMLTAGDGTQAAIAYFLAVDPMHPEQVRAGANIDWLVGAAEAQVLLYAPEPLAADSLWGRFLGDTSYAAGYHVLSPQPGTECGPPQEWRDANPEYDAFFAGDVDDNADPMGEGALVPASATMSGTGEAPALPYPEEPNYVGYDNICGNGICEAAEDCKHCSDCSCDGQSTGISNEDVGYMCIWTPPVLGPSPEGAATPIQVLIAAPEEIRLPEFGN